MALIAPGLLLGMLGLVWGMIIGIMQVDYRATRESPRAQDKPLAEAARCDPKAA